MWIFHWPIHPQTQFVTRFVWLIIHIIIKFYFYFCAFVFINMPAHDCYYSNKIDRWKDTMRKNLKIGFSLNNRNLYYFLNQIQFNPFQIEVYISWNKTRNPDKVQLLVNYIMSVHFLKTNKEVTVILSIRYWLNNKCIMLTLMFKSFIKSWKVLVQTFQPIMLSTVGWSTCFLKS